MKKMSLVFLALTTFLFAKPVVTATILPTKYFIEQIAGDSLEVNVMVGKGADPHTYEPRPAQMKELEKSQLYFSVGIEFDDVWLDRITKQQPNLKVIKTDEGIKKIAMVAHHHDDEDEEHECHDEEHHHHHHHHEGNDPHIWLDPILVKTQATTIKEALTSQFPQNRELYEKNYQNFIKELDTLDSWIKESLKDVKNRAFIVYHPSWGYFAKRYNLVQIPIELEGKEPKPKELKELIEEAKEHDIKIIFVAPQFSKQAAIEIGKQSGAKVVEVDQLPLSWMDEMKKSVDILKSNL